MLGVGTPDFHYYFCGVTATVAAESVPVLNRTAQHISPAGGMSNCMYVTSPCEKLIYSL